MFAADHMKRNNAWDEFHNHNQNHPHHNHNHSHVHPPYNGGGGHQSDSGAHLIPIHVMDPSAQYTRKYKNLHHFPNPSADHSMSGRSYSPPMMDLPLGGMGMGMDMDMDSPNFNPGGFPPSMTSSDYDYPGKSQQIHKIEIPSCFRQAEDENGAKGGVAPNSNSNSNGTRINGGPPPPIDIHGGSTCPQAQALYNNFMEQQQNQQQSPNPNSSSSSTTPLNSPGFNSGIRHIPIFFEGKVKNGVNPNNNNNTNNNSQNNNVNNNNQSSSQSKNNNTNNNAKEQLKSAPIPLPPPASIPIPVRSGKSPEERKFSNSTSPPRSPAEDGVKPPPRQKNCVNNNNNANNNNNSDESAQPPLKKPTPTPQTTTTNPNQNNNNNNTSAEIPIPIPVIKGQSSNNSSGSSSPVKTPLERVQLISEDVRKLEKDVQEFEGNSKTKEYLYLDEMLTRNLLRLDDICVEGQIEVRMARKECINLVNNCIQKLEAKLEKNDSNNNNNNSSSSGSSTGRELVPVDQNQIVKIPGGDKSKNNGSLSSSCKGGTPFFHRSEVNLVVNGEN